MIRRLVALVAALGMAMATPSWAEDVYQIGVAPHTSARVIVEQYQPVRLAVEKAVGHPVEIVTAPDFTEFARRAVAGEYDMAITTGHQAELLRMDAGYLPLVTYKADFRAVLVVTKESPIRKPSGLDGTVVLGLNPSSLVTLWGMHWLKSNNVHPKDVRHISAADSVGQLLLAGEAAGGFMSLANFQKLAPEVQAQLRIQEQSQPLAGRVYMLNARRTAERNTIHAALGAFAATPQGLKYFDDNKLDGYRDITAAELATMAPYADEVRAVLKGPATKESSQ